jgi:hypothetical protein
VLKHRLFILTLIITAVLVGSSRVAREKIPEWQATRGNETDRRLATNFDPHKDDTWRAGAKLPTLITDKLLAYRQVCDEAKVQNQKLEQAGKPARKFALVLGKMHLCDYMFKSCMYAARTFFDPCNHFITDNFIPFHARTYFDNGAQPPGGKEMIKLYEFPSGPHFTAIDLETCQPLKHTVTENNQTYVETGISANSERKIGDAYAFQADDRTTRFAEMRSVLRELFAANPDAFAKIDPREWDKNSSELGCTDDEKNTPILADPIFVPQIRQLMNEQYHQVTGLDAKAILRWPSNARH